MGQDRAIKVDEHIWMRMMKRYAIAMCIGIVILIYVFPQLHTAESQSILMEALLGGMFAFGGAFGIAVSLFFHLWHKKDVSQGKH